MARLEPLPYREVERRLRTAGFSIAGQRGSHVKFIWSSGGVTRTAIVPPHAEISLGTLRSILRQAGIEPERWDILG